MNQSGSEGLRWLALGDAAWLARMSGVSPEERLAAALSLAKHLRGLALPGATDVVNGYESVAVYTTPAAHQNLRELLPPQLPREEAIFSHPGRTLEIPVVYGGTRGPDLEAAAQALGLSPAQLVAQHSGTEFTVASIGFSPGFPYLTGLPPALRLPRKATPVPVAAGAVAIAGCQAGIYPQASPAGWHVLGHTNLRLFAPDSPSPCLLQPGDKLRFVPAGEAKEAEMQAPSPVLSGDLEVLSPGLLTTVQDLGRPGWRALGVAPGGAMDPPALAAANLLVGNEPGCAGLEICLTGPRLRFHRKVCVAWCGWREGGHPLALEPGAELDLSHPPRGTVGYLAVAGGVAVPPCLGSRATDLRGGFGGCHGRGLRPGDRLEIGEPPQPIPARGAWRVGWPPAVEPGRVLEIRCLAGLQEGEFSTAARHCFYHRLFHTSTQSNRMGLRMVEGIVPPPQHASMLSQPLAAGAVQVPPDGRPSVLLAEGQTLGGYPLIAHVISADLPALARALPGTPVRFVAVTLREARDAWRLLSGDLALLRHGILFTYRGTCLSSMSMRAKEHPASSYSSPKQMR